MGYWQTVLEEVLHKQDPLRRIAFTNVREYSPLKKSPANKKKFATPSPLQPQNDKAKKYSLGKKYPLVYFTQREAQVMFYTLNGFGIKKIAALFTLSPRTVEFYVNNMKAKLHCRFKSELMTKVAESEFLKLVDFG